jgi:hypothetical protein
LPFAESRTNGIAGIISEDYQSRFRSSMYAAKARRARTRSYAGLIMSRA